MASRLIRDALRATRQSATEAPTDRAMPRSVYLDAGAWERLAEIADEIPRDPTSGSRPGPSVAIRHLARAWDDPVALLARLAELQNKSA